MQVTTFQGEIENGQIRLPTDVQLPDKTKVYVGEQITAIRQAQGGFQQEHCYLRVPRSQTQRGLQPKSALGDVLSRRDVGRVEGDRSAGHCWQRPSDYSALRGDDDRPLP